MRSIFFSQQVHGEVARVLIAPVICYDGAGKRLELQENPNRRIRRELERYWFKGLLRFRAVAEEEYGSIASVLDAERAIVASGAEYVLYGYARRNEESWYCELKLYSGRERIIAERFFAADGAERYERLMERVCANMREHFNELVGQEGRAGSLAYTQAVEFRVPVALCAWSPTGAKWRESLLGLMGAGIGVEFFPELKRPTRFGVSVSVESGWRLGLGSPDRYEALLNALTVAGLLTCYARLDVANTLSGSIGALYELELLKVTGKYEEQERHAGQRFGVMVRLGYEHAVSERWSLFMSMEGDFYVSRGAYHVLKPNFGVVYRAYRRKR